MKKITLFFICLIFAGASALWAQNVQVSGVVTDASDGSALPGVTVVVKGTSTSAATDVNGRYTISAPANAVLVFSVMGMETREVSVDGRTTINVDLREDAVRLDDVIVLAFGGTSSRPAFTGSVATIGAKDLEKRVTTNIANSLAGAMAGVQLRVSDGAPGSGSTANVRIRGFTSLYAENEPLVIVDGAPYTGSLSTINNADIETFTVLKDAAASALYGARAANGVILITTKNAKKKDAVITVDARMSVRNYSTIEYDVIRDPQLYYETYYSGLYNYYYNGLGQSAAMAELNANNLLLERLKYNVYSLPAGEQLIVGGKLNPNATLGNRVTYDGKDYYLTPDNWSDYAYKTGIRQEYNVTASAGTDKSAFYASIGYLDEKGIVEKSQFKRYTARLRADYDAKKWLKIGGNFSYYTFKQELPGNYDSGGSSANIFAFTARIAPIFPLFMRDGDGNIMIDERGMKMYDYGDRRNAGLERPFLTGGNPLSAIQLNEESYNGSTFNLYGFADIKFTDKLKLHLNATSYLAEYRSTNFTNRYYGQFASENGIISIGANRTNNLNLQQLLSYTDKIGDHSFEVMVGHDYTNSKGYGLSGRRNNSFSDLVFELNHAIEGERASSSATEYNTEGFIGRAMYDYDKKYYASASFRRDASSYFHPDDRWGNFWSLSGAWLISEESFFKNLNLSWVNMLKAKASYGSVGNDRIGAFRYTDRYLIGNAAGMPGLTFDYKGNKGISWETNASFNVGIEFDLLGKRLMGSIEYYNRSTYDMLFQRPAPESAGYSSFFDNIGDMRNYGVEIDLRGVIFSTPDFEWTMNTNLSTVKNIITKLPPERVHRRIRGYYGFSSGGNWYSEGGSIYDFYRFRYAGVNEYGEALYYQKILDNEGNHIGDRTVTNPSEADQYHGLGSSIPKFYGGFGSSLYYKGFDLSFTFDYQVGGKVDDTAYASMMSSPSNSSAGDAIHKDMLQAWSTNNTGSNIPRFQYNEANNQTADSDRFLVSASYLNFQNINLGYTIPHKWTKEIGISSIRIYCSVENILYWSKRKGLDPRQSYSGATRNTNYGIPRTITGGVQFTF